MLFYLQQLITKTGTRSFSTTAGDTSKPDTPGGISGRRTTQRSAIASFVLLIVLLVVACGEPAPSESPPQTLTAGRCRTSADCTTTCYGPEKANLCVPDGCPNNSCNADIDCQSMSDNAVCESTSGIRRCLPSCNDSARCEDHQICENNGHCENKACDNDSDCPVNFACLSASCQRRFCSTDDACDGYCVLGSCYDVPGSCSD